MRRVQEEGKDIKEFIVKWRDAFKNPESCKKLVKRKKYVNELLKYLMTQDLKK